MCEIRNRDHREPHSDPYKVLELAKKLNFNEKFRITLQALSKVIRQKELTGELAKVDLNTRVQLNE